LLSAAIARGEPWEIVHGLNRNRNGTALMIVSCITAKRG